MKIQAMSGSCQVCDDVHYFVLYAINVTELRWMNIKYNPGNVVLGNWTLTKLIGEGDYECAFESERKDFSTTYKAGNQNHHSPANA